MIDIQNRDNIPSLVEFGDYIRNTLFMDFCREMEVKYGAKYKLEFSKCSWEHGWNLKFKKSGKSLCTVYPRENYFTVLIVVGKKEKEEVEYILSQMSVEVQNIYHQTTEGNGQRWLMIDLEDDGSVYRDALELVKIRCGA